MFGLGGPAAELRGASKMVEIKQQFRRPGKNLLPPRAAARNPLSRILTGAEFLVLTGLTQIRPVCDAPLPTARYCC
jgi:hypothetical protein